MFYIESFVGNVKKKMKKIPRFLAGLSTVVMFAQANILG